MPRSFVYQVRALSGPSRKEVNAMRAEADRSQAERLVKTYADLILRLSYTYLKNTQDAEDICHDAREQAAMAEDSDVEDADK